MEMVSLESLFFFFFPSFSLLYPVLSVLASLHQYAHTLIMLLLSMQHISAKPVGHITAHEHDLIYALYADARENKSR